MGLGETGGRAERGELKANVGCLGGSGKCPTPDFGSGHDLTVMISSPASGSALSLLGILSPSLPLPCSHAHALSFSPSLKIKNKIKAHVVNNCQLVNLDEGYTGVLYS